MTDSPLHFKKPPDHEIINDIAIELGVDPSFVEKDWYAVQVIDSILRYEDAKITPVFSGGTNLSKAYGLIKRFSEDIDFRTNFSEAPSRGEMRAYREGLVALINGFEHLSVVNDTLKSRDSSRFFSFDIEYPKSFDTPSALRSNLKLELKFREPQTQSELKEVGSFVSAFTNQPAEASVHCIKPEETAADKLSALIWRVLDRDRSVEHDDPAMIRHLHDLCALLDVIFSNQETFTDLTRASFNEDLDRGGEKITQTLGQAAQSVLDTLRTDTEYRVEYTNFVTGMSYSTEDEQINFEDALVALKKIIAIFED